MNNNIIDKVYIALELTKVRYEKTENITDVDILNTYQYYLKELTGIENLSDVEELHYELEKYKKLYSDLKTNPLKNYENKNIEHWKNMLEILDESMGDMEPYVYNKLYEVIKKNI